MNRLTLHIGECYLGMDLPDNFLDREFPEKEKLLQSGYIAILNEVERCPSLFKKQKVDG